MTFNCKHKRDRYTAHFKCMVVRHVRLQLDSEALVKKAHSISDEEWVEWEKLYDSHNPQHLLPLDRT